MTPAAEKAHASTRAADAASNTANQGSGPPSTRYMHHKAAESAHNKAAKDHEAAAKEAGDEDTSGHTDAASGHKDQAKAHGNAAKTENENKRGY